MSNTKKNRIDLNIGKIRFLSDQPLLADEIRDMRFGHPGIADNLREIILKCPLPFTIGLFGKWGSGKTTIINLLRDKLKADKVAFVKFDIWKHEKDSLRRVFLKELVKQCKSSHHLPNDFELSQNIRNSIEKTIEGEFKWSKKWKPILWGIISIIIIGAIIAICSNYFWAYLSIIFGGSLPAALLIWILTQTITRETLTVTQDPFKDPHEFEEEFEKIVNNIYSDKLLIVIDNLDRCTHNRAVELLSTVKTFLAKDTDLVGDNKCLFLIACDDKAIKEHLKSVYNSKTSFGADEFLRKFFNTFLRIPDFIDTELQTYTEYLLKDIKIHQFNSADVAYVITKAFRENPRQIKQFINSLISNYILAHQRENGSNPLIIPKGTITDNIPFLAKISVIRQKFPEQFKEIREQNLLVNEFNTINDEKFKEFDNATKTILAPDIRPFIFMKQSEEELAIPGIKELELELTDNKIDQVKERLKNIKKNLTQLMYLKIFITNLIERNKHRKISLFNIISSVLDSFKYYSLVMPETFYNKIAELLNDNEALKSELSKFDPSLIFDEILKRCNEDDRNAILAQYFDILLKHNKEEKEAGLAEDYSFSLIKELLAHKDLMDINRKNELKSIITEKYSSLKILSLFKDNADNQKEFIATDTLIKFVKSFSIHDVENIEGIKEKTSLIVNFDQIIDPSVAKDIILTLQSLFKNENQKPFNEAKEKFLEYVEDLINTFTSQIAEIPDKTHLNTFSEEFMQGINSLGDMTQKKIFIFTSLFLVDLIEPSKKAILNELIRNFFNAAEMTAIKYVFDKYKPNEKKELILKYKDIFQSRSLREQPILDFLFPLAQQEIRSEWMVDLISSNPHMAFTKLKELNFKVEDKKNVVNQLLITSQQANIQERGEFYNAINKMKCANDAFLRKKLSEHIKTLIISTDPNHQQIGYSALRDAKHLSESLRREINREIIDWLSTLQPDNAYQTYSVKSILFNWDIMVPILKGKYIDFVFDKLIIKGINKENIQLGYEILFNVKPTYKEYSIYFEDVFDRVEDENDIEIKKELKNGLLRLQPDKKKKGEKGFWEKLEKL